MAEDENIDWLTTQEIAILADALTDSARQLGKLADQARLTSRALRAMLRQVHSSDRFRLPPS